MSQFLGFGNGHDGSVATSGTINTYAAMTGAVSGTTVVTSLSVSVGDMVLLHQNQAANAGKWELVTVASTGSGQFTSAQTLATNYVTGAQAVLVPQYTGGTISGTITATDWAGTSGGIIALCSSGALTLTGTINSDGDGFVGGAGDPPTQTQSPGATQGYQGEAVDGSEAQSTAANDQGGGGGKAEEAAGNQSVGGGGGGHGATGSNGVTGGDNTTPGTGGTTGGIDTLTTAIFGGGGGGGCLGPGVAGYAGKGGDGGGFVLIIAREFVCSAGTLTCDGSAGAVGYSEGSGGGGGAGGSILIKAQIATLGTSKVAATGGAGGAEGSGGNGTDGGAGAVGRISLYYSGSYTGTTSPTLTATKDVSLADQVGSFLFNMV